MFFVDESHRCFQNLANQVEFDGSKEAYMVPVRETLKEHLSKYRLLTFPFQCNQFIIENLENLRKFLQIFLHVETHVKCAEETKHKSGASLVDLKKYINSKQSVISQVLALRFERDEYSLSGNDVSATRSMDTLPSILCAEMKKEGSEERNGLSDSQGSEESGREEKKNSLKRKKAI